MALWERLTCRKVCLLLFWYFGHLVVSFRLVFCPVERCSDLRSAGLIETLVLLPAGAEYWHRTRSHQDQFSESDTGLYVNSLCFLYYRSDPVCVCVCVCVCVFTVVGWHVWARVVVSECSTPSGFTAINWGTWLITVIPYFYILAGRGLRPLWWFCTCGKLLEETAEKSMQLFPCNNGLDEV